MSSRLEFCLRLVLAATLPSVPAVAGSTVVGSLARCLNTTVEGQAVQPRRVIFSGDHLQVKDGAAVLAMDNGSRMAFGPETTASFQRDEHAVTVALSSGNVSLYHADGRVPLRVQAGAVTVEASPGYRALGEVAMADGAVVVTAKEGTLRVNDGLRTLEVPKGKTITVKTKTAPTAGARGSPKVGGGRTGLKAGVLGAGAAGVILAAEPSEDNDCDKDDRSPSPHKPPKCPH